MKFLLDANIPASSLETFKSLHQEVTHVRQIGLSSATDQEIAKYSTDS
jgi:predicted nuclease of predicted toxin-antitoxin system